MFSKLRRRVSVPGAISMIALFFAMSGGAFAAKYMISSTNQISPKVLKKLKGATGPAGVTGAAGVSGQKGATGQAGPTGATGSIGVTGPTGAPGTNGTNGATGATGAPGTNGTNGATGATGATGAAGTNGTNGTNGATGATGPAGTTLPSGMTSTGTWATSFVNNFAVNIFNYAAISFPLETTFVPVFKWVGPANATTPGAVEGCPGTASEPKAVASTLCVYSANLTSMAEPPVRFPAPQVARKSGVVLQFETTGEAAKATGTWAVTAP